MKRLKPGQQSRPRNEFGFSTIQLLILAAIVGILMGAFAELLNSQLHSSKALQTISGRDQLRSALQNYISDPAALLNSAYNPDNATGNFSSCVLRTGCATTSGPFALYDGGPATNPTDANYQKVGVTGAGNKVTPYNPLLGLGIAFFDIYGKICPATVTNFSSTCVYKVETDFSATCAGGGGCAAPISIMVSFKITYAGVGQQVGAIALNSSNSETSSGSHSTKLPIKLSLGSEYEDYLPMWDLAVSPAPLSTSWTTSSLSQRRAKLASAPPVWQIDAGSDTSRANVTVNGNLTVDNVMSGFGVTLTAGGLVAKSINVSYPDSTKPMPYPTIYGATNAFQVISNTGRIWSWSSAWSPGYYYVSDRRLKENISPLLNAEEKIAGLNGRRFHWINSGKADIGFIAQDVQKVLPELVQVNPNGYLTVEYGNILAVLTEAFNSSNARHDSALAEQDQQLKEP